MVAVRRCLLILLLFFGGAALCWAPSRAAAEPLSIGIALEDTVWVYRDSAAAADVVAALPLAQYALVLGVGADSSQSFDQGGWTRVETREGVGGWVRSPEVAIPVRLTFFAVPGDSLYHEPDRAASVDTVREANPFSIRARREIGGETWFNIVQYSAAFWVPLLRFQRAELYADLAAHYAGGWVSSYNFLSLTGERRRSFGADPTKALRIVRHALEITEPQETIYTEDYWYVRSSGRAYILNRIRHIHEALEQYEEAARALRQIVEGSRSDRLYGHPAAAFSALNLGKLYRDALNDTARSIETFQEVVREFPGVGISGFEWNSWVDINAAEFILELAAEPPERLAREARRIVETSADSTVRLIGHRGWLRSRGEVGGYQTMLDSAVALLNRHPSDTRYFFKTGVDYSVGILGDVLDVLLERLEFERYYAAVETMGQRLEAEALRSFVLAHAARTADHTDADLDLVVARYRQLAQEPRRSWWHHVSRIFYSASDGEQRLGQLNEFIAYESVVKTESAALRLGLAGRYPAVDTLARGTGLTVLYSSRPMASAGVSKPHSKVRLQDGRVGWVDQESLQRPAIRQSPGVAVANVNGAGWHMPLANAQNNPVFVGPSIVRPAITRVLEGFDVDRLRFYDVNGDLNQDFIVTDKGRPGRVVALDGVTLDTLARFGEAFSVVLGGDRLFLHTRDGTRCYDFLAGDFVWNHDKGEGLSFDPVFFDGHLYYAFRNDAVDGRPYEVVCIKAANGERVWSKGLGEGISYGRGMVVSGKAVVVQVGKDGETHLMGLDLSSGRKLWQRQKSGRLDLMSADENTLFAFLGADSVAAIDLGSGALNWAFKHPTDSERASDARIVNTRDQVILSDRNLGLLSLAKKDGLLEWAALRDIRPFGLTVVGDAVHVVHNGRDLVSLSLDTGREHWRVPLLQNQQSKIMYQSGSLYLRSPYGAIVVSDSVAAKAKKDRDILFNLQPNYPNPFNGQTTIPYILTQERRVELSVYNILGQRVRRLVDTVQTAGLHRPVWHGVDDAGKKVSSGVYFYRLRIGDQGKSRRMLFIQ